jgi:hypothetical protein
MLQSHPIDVDGVFVGAAVRLESGFRFVAVNLRVEDLDGIVRPALADINTLARRYYRGAST